jgi:DNA-binding XRE family transcriptional regulator
VEGFIPFEQVLEEELRDPAFRAEWERLAPARALANRLIGLRVDNGLTQTALARQIGVSPETIRRLEIGEHFPSPRTLARIESFAESTAER